MSTQSKHLKVFNTGGTKRKGGSMTAREIAAYVKKETGEDLEFTDLKSRKRIATKALQALVSYDEHQAVCCGKTDEEPKMPQYIGHRDLPDNVCCDPVTVADHEAKALGLTPEQYDEHIEELLEPALHAADPLNVLDLTELSRWDMAAHYRAATGKGIRATKLGVLFSSRWELARDLAIGLNYEFDDFIC
jgi:hypothetical protein